MRTDRPALIELLLAVALRQFPPDLLGEEARGDRIGGQHARVDHQRLGPRLVRLFGGDVAVLRHAADDVVAPLDGAIVVAERVERTRLLRQGGEIGDFGDGQFVHRLVEIVQRRGGDAVVGKAEVDFIEIELEDLFLRIGRLDSHAQQDLADLAVESPVRVQEEVLRHLLGDGRGALDVVRTLEVDETRAHDALGIDAVVGVEVLVLGRYERFLDQGGNFVRRADRAAARANIPRAGCRRRRGRASSPAAHSSSAANSPAGPARYFQTTPAKTPAATTKTQRAGREYEADNAGDTAHLSIEAFHCARRRALEASRRTLISAPEGAQLTRPIRSPSVGRSDPARNRTRRAGPVSFSTSANV